MIVHHTPLDPSLRWNLHAWQLSWDGNLVWDPVGVAHGAWVDFNFPDVDEPRNVEFKYRSTSQVSGQTVWEPDDYVRRIVDPSVAEVWTFANSPRVLTHAPQPNGVSFSQNDRIVVQAITRQRFAGGRLYAWNPYDPQNPSAYFAETARDNVAGVSTFTVQLAGWMVNGFHFKLVGKTGDGKEVWEPDASNRIWRPGDGASIWIKSGQCDVRDTAIPLTSTNLEVLVPSSGAVAPTLVVTDVAEGLDININPASVSQSAGSALFNVVRYQPQIYPQAAYRIRVADGAGESSPINRPFPANPAQLANVSRFVLGAGSWVTAFPVPSPAKLSILGQAQSAFAAGVRVRVFLGNSTVPYQDVPAISQPNNMWVADLSLASGTTTAIRLALANAAVERRPYEWIDTGRYFTPRAAAAQYFTTEGIYGITSRRPTQFSEPPVARIDLMRSVFGAAIANASIFTANEMPHGGFIAGNRVFFVVHAPHAACASLVLVQAAAGGGSTRREIPMFLSADTLYWWCSVSTQDAPFGTRYRFILNDDLEVLDPAARDVLDTGNFDVSYQGDPDDPATAWSRLLDADSVRRVARGQPWTTMGWQNLLIYEMHVKRFSDGSPGAVPFDIVADQLAGAGGSTYLRDLPVTALELLPVQEFNSSLSWGYDPSFYFAIDNHYGGSDGLARLVKSAHQSGRAVLLDVVYNHSLGSSLMKIAPDVYRNGDYLGDRMNCGHPMVGQLLRQATLYLWHTFGIDGIRFDDTRTIAGSQGGWAFMAMIRSALRAAATAEGQPWPYCVAENSATRAWDISDPGFGVWDGEWDIDEVYRIRDASYDLWHDGADDADRLRHEMDAPAYWGRPFYQGARFGESHDMVSEQDSGNKRIASRPPFGCGLQLAKAMGTVTLLSNGVPMLFMGQEVAEVAPFAFDNAVPPLNPQQYLPLAGGQNAKVWSWFTQLMGLRNDPNQGLQGDANLQTVGIGRRTVAFACGAQRSIFAVVTFGTPDQSQDSGWLGLPAGPAYKEIFNSSWPAFQVESEPERTNGGYGARIQSGQILNLPRIGAVVLQRV